MLSFDARPRSGPRPPTPDKKPKQQDSVRARREKLAGLKTQAEALENDVLAATHRFVGRTAREYQAESAKTRRLDALRRSIERAEFDLLTPKEQELLRREYLDLHWQLLDIPNAERNGPAGEALRAAMRKIRERFPRDEAEKSIKTDERRRQRELERRLTEERVGFDRRFELTAQKCLEAGLRELAGYLESIQESQGELPTTVIFPETSSRPLAYAVKPLLEKAYSRVGQPTPEMHFVKVYSRFAYLGRLDGELAGLRHRYGKVMDERRRLLVEYRKERDADRRQSLSGRIQSLYSEAVDLARDIPLKEAELRSSSYEDGERVVLKRVRQLDAVLAKGPILVIDDVVSSATTIKQLAKAFEATGHAEQAYYFSFISASHPPLEGASIQPDHFAAGVVFAGDEAMPDRGFRHGKIVCDDGQDEWSELLVLGFPYRADKVAASGVIKDQDDLAPLVRRAPPDALARAASVKREYLNLGREIADRLSSSGHSVKNNPFG